MPLNRLETRPSLLCATPDALLAYRGRGSGITAIADLGEDTGPSCHPSLRKLLDAQHSGSGFARVLLRVERPLDSPGQDRLDTLAWLKPDGFVIAGCRSGADIQQADVMLRVSEARLGLAAGSLAIFAEVGALPELCLDTRSLSSLSPRLEGIVFDGEALTAATGSLAVNEPAGRPGTPLLLARAAIVIKARQAGLSCHDLLSARGQGLRSQQDLRDLRDAALSDGFTGLVARDSADLQAC